MMNLRIDEPCHESWNRMTPEDKGRYCDKCCKTVFDFTQMPTEEVIRFIASQQKGSVCGRFTSEQVIVPVAATVQPGINFRFKKFLAALLLVFGGTLFTGCHEEPMGKLIDVDSVGKKMGQNITPDTMPRKKDTTAKKPVIEKNTLKGKVECVKPKEEVYYNGGATIQAETLAGFTMREENTDFAPGDSVK